MLGRAIICLSLALAVLLLSCTKQPEWVGAGEGAVAVEKLPEVDSIPLEWGNLVSSNVISSQPWVCQLWFQDENGTLRLVHYDVRDNVFISNARLIPRK